MSNKVFRSELSIVHENAICPFQGLLILTNIGMTLLKWVLREPVFSVDTLYQVDTSKGPEGVHLYTGAAVLCRILTGINGNNGFQLFLYVLLNFTL